MPRLFALILISAMLLVAAKADDVPTVFAAASLRDVLEDAAAAYGQSGNRPVRLVFAASSVLARQIDAGAPADIFVSADEEWIGWLAMRGAINPEQTRILAGNALVVGFRPGGNPPQKLDAMLTSGRFAMGDPGHVPAGRYAAAALKKMQIWEIVRPYAVYCENVRIALEFLRRGEVESAVIYASDLTAAPELVKAYTFPDGSHKPIRYAAAPVVGGDADALGFLEFLSGDKGQALFGKHGFRRSP